MIKEYLARVPCGMWVLWHGSTWSRDFTLSQDRQTKPLSRAHAVWFLSEKIGRKEEPLTIDTNTAAEPIGEYIGSWRIEDFHVQIWIHDNLFVNAYIYRYV